MARAWWKWLGVAGVVGVAATGAAIARQERARASYSPDEIRARLHARHDDAMRGRGEADVKAETEPK